MGLSLLECFGGDPECTPPFGRGVIVRHCAVPELAAQRAVLLTKLDSLAGLHPASDWITGQRVYLAIKNGDARRASEIAEGCEGTPWWCQALEGYARHHEVPGTGGRELSSAFLAVPPNTPAWDRPRVPEAGERGTGCEWTDLRPLLSDSVLIADYGSAGPCGGRQAFEERFWWLSDPFWSVPGNERWDEHITRNVQARLRDEILRVAPEPAWWDPGTERRTAEGYHARERHVELLRTGSWNSWRSVRWGYHSGGGLWLEYSASGRLVSDTLQGGRKVPPIQRRTSQRYRVGYVNGGYSFTPDAARFHDPMRSTAADWSVTWNEGHERMITSETWYNVEHQTAVLRRGDSLLVVAAARVPVLLRSPEAARGALAMGRPSDLHLEVVPARVDGSGVARARAQLGDAEWIASLEVAGDGWRGRARHGAPAPLLEDGFGVSAPVFVDERSESAGLLLHEALLPSKGLGARDRVGVYVEIYGVAEAEPLEIRMSVEPVDVRPSLLQRIGRAFGVGRPADAPLHLSWLEPAELLMPGVAARNLSVATRSLASGDYHLVIEVRRTDGATMRSSTALRIGSR